jgi:hydroxypyruvate reductase
MASSKTNLQLRDDALAFWHAGLAAVRSDRLVLDNLRVEGEHLVVGEEALPLGRIRRIAVVGAGKAGAGMAAGVEQALGPRLLAEKQVTGWVNVPADCVRPLAKIHLHAARPPGVNEPTAEGVIGSERILQLVGSLGPDDLCLCLISGGGSALLPAPAPGISLADKQAVTRHLSAAGANIAELNTVRKQLSRIKGGGLARACRAGRLITLIISDVLGDPLDVIASGPTVPNQSTAADALSILERYGGAPPSILDYLASQRANQATAPPELRPPAVSNLVIGNNALAVDAAGQEAVRRGYSPAMTAATSLEGPAEDIGIHLARMARQMASEPGPDCLITGGEPIVRLAPPEQRGKGGRNQQLVLAALAEIFDFGFSILDSGPVNPKSTIQNPKFCLLSAGTDGEDGPTDAAGAVIDGDLIGRLIAKGSIAKGSGVFGGSAPSTMDEPIPPKIPDPETPDLQALDPRDFLRRNDAYSFFERVGGLIKSGPTHTNVCDVRVVLVDRATTG